MQDSFLIQKSTEPLGDTTAQKETDDKSVVFWCDYHHLNINDVIMEEKIWIPGKCCV